MVYRKVIKLTRIRIAYTEPLRFIIAILWFLAIVKRKEVLEDGQRVFVYLT